MTPQTVAAGATIKITLETFYVPLEPIGAVGWVRPNKGTKSATGFGTFVGTNPREHCRMPDHQRCVLWSAGDKGVQIRAVQITFFEHKKLIV
jgi:hypothetical protein